MKMMVPSLHPKLSPAHLRSFDATIAYQCHVEHSKQARLENHLASAEGSCKPTRTNRSCMTYSTGLGGAGEGRQHEGSGTPDRSMHERQQKGTAELPRELSVTLAYAPSHSGQHNISTRDSIGIG